MNKMRWLFVTYKSIFKTFSTYINKGKFGILFDIDGVLIQGSRGVDGARKMFELMNTHNFNIPISFLTNSCDPPETKSSLLNDIFNINIEPRQVIHAPAPLKLFTDIHNHRILFVGQGNIKKTAHDLNFTNVVDLSDIQTAYPTLDVMDKLKRRALKNGYIEKGMDPIDGIVIIGEPTDWQSYLQIIIDLLVSHGNLSSMSVDMSCQKLPIYLCNLDFLYKAESSMLRFGNGAFIYCLEMLYKKYTGLNLQYSAIIGKPGEISFRYAEHVLRLLNQQLNREAELERIYLIGDNPASDILGANLYQKFIDQPINLPQFRSMPESFNMLPRTVKSIKSLLVRTGVYNEINLFCDRYKHLTFLNTDKELLKPTFIVDDCLEAFYRILEYEMILSVSGTQ